MGRNKFCFAKAATVQIRTPEIGIGEIGPAEVCMRKIGSGKIGPRACLIPADETLVCFEDLRNAFSAMSNRATGPQPRRLEYFDYSHRFSGDDSDFTKLCSSVPSRREAVAPTRRVWP